MTTGPGDRWVAGDAYEAYMGRWSRSLARGFVEWLQPVAAAHWLEIGCGTGALTSTIAARCEPASVVACDPSAGFVEHARAHLQDPRVSFVVTGADALPHRPGGFDIVVSGLVLNFVPDIDAVLRSVSDRLCPSGVIAAYVWDYAEGMEFLRVFWEEAAALDTRAIELDEARRFPLCRPPALSSVFRAAGLSNVETDTIEITTEFLTFDDYWQPFLRGTGPAPSYVASLDSDERDRLRLRLEQRLSPGGGPIPLRARAWAVRGVKP